MRPIQVSRPPDERSRRWQFFEENRAAFDKAAESVCVGQVIKGQAVFYRGRTCLLKLDNGILAELEERLDADRDYPVRWIDALHVGDYAEVVIRLINRKRKSVCVSLHNLQHDGRYAVFDSGYRHCFDATERPLWHFPWNGGSEQQKPKRGWAKAL